MINRRNFIISAVSAAALPAWGQSLHEYMALGLGARAANRNEVIERSAQLIDSMERTIASYEVLHFRTLPEVRIEWDYAYQCADISLYSRLLVRGRRYPETTTNWWASRAWKPVTHYPYIDFNNYYQHHHLWPIYRPLTGVELAGR